MHLLQTQHFPQEDFDFATEKKSSEKTLNQVFHFGWLRLEPEFKEKIDTKLFITLLLTEPRHFQVGTKHLGNSANQFTLTVVTIIVCGALPQRTHLCASISPHANEEVNKIRGNGIKKHSECVLICERLQVKAVVQALYQAICGLLLAFPEGVWWYSGREVGCSEMAERRKSTITFSKQF